MPFNGSGTFNRLYNWAVDAANNINILSTKMDAEMNGMAAGLTNCITRDGQSPPSADIPWGAKRITNLGAATVGTDALNRDTADARYILASVTNLTLAGTLTAVTGTFSGNATVGGTLGVTGNVTVGANAGAGNSVFLNGASGTLRGLGWQTGGVYAADITLQADNTTLRYSSSGVHSFSISGTQIAVVSGTGVAVTGTLSATGAITCPTPTVGDNSTKVATTAFVVASFAPLASPPLTGTPTAPTAAAGTATTQLATTAFVDALRDVPSNAYTTSQTLALTHRGQGADFNGTTLTCTIPANGSVAFPVGTTIVLTNINASSLSIAITTDTLTLAGTTTTGTRTLAQNGMATLRKITTTSWLISGAGLS